MITFVLVNEIMFVQSDTTVFVLYVEYHNQIAQEPSLKLTNHVVS